MSAQNEGVWSRGKSRFLKGKEYPSRAEMNFVFSVKVMKLRFRKEEYIAENPMVDEWFGQNLNLNFLLPKHKVSKNLPVASLK